MIMMIMMMIIIRIYCARQFLISVRSRLGLCGRDYCKYLVYAANQTLTVRPVGCSLSGRCPVSRRFEMLTIKYTGRGGCVTFLSDFSDRPVRFAAALTEAWVPDGRCQTAAVYSMQGQSKVKLNSEIEGPSRTSSMAFKCQRTTKLCATQSNASGSTIRMMCKFRWIRSLALVQPD